nr:MAG TPA: hypothetical protein [Caudoviricetes sp.]
MFDVDRYAPKKKNRSIFRLLKFYWKRYLRWNRLKNKKKEEETIKSKVNIKRGFRRIVIVFICVIALFTLTFYILNGFIFDSNKFAEKIKFYETKNNFIEMQDFLDFINESNDTEHSIYIYSIECKPYKQICSCGKDYSKLENNKTITVHERATNKLIKEYKIKMPSKLQYFTWQILDFLLIPFWGFIAYLIYLIIEFTLSWIIKGFKS